MAQKKTFKEKAISLLESAEKMKKRGPRRPVFYTGSGKDALASGAAKSANYSGYNVSQMEWDQIFMTDKEFKKTYKVTKARFNEEKP